MWQRWHSQACAEPAAEGASPFWPSGRQPCSPRGSWIPAVTTEDKLRTRAFPGVCLCPFASVPGATEGKGQAWGQCAGGGACPAQGPQKVTGQAWGQCRGGIPTPGATEGQAWGQCGGAYVSQGPQTVMGQAWGQCAGGGACPAQGPQKVTGQAWGQCVGGWRAHPRCRLTGSALGQLLRLL